MPPQQKQNNSLSLLPLNHSEHYLLTVPRPVEEALMPSLPLKQATSCHDPRQRTLKSMWFCHSLALPRICYTPFIFRWCSLSVMAYLKLLWVARSLCSWSSFRECSSMASTAFKNHTKTCPTFLWFLEAGREHGPLMQLPESPEAMWEHTPFFLNVCKGRLSRIVVECWWTLACHPKCLDILPLTCVS